jgi:hypothetical protein
MNSFAYLRISSGSLHLNCVVSMVSEPRFEEFGDASGEQDGGAADE